MTGCRSRDCDHLTFRGRLVVTTCGGRWQMSTPRASGTGDVETAREYVRRAMSGELRNVEVWRPGTPDEYVLADVYGLDWSHA